MDEVYEHIIYDDCKNLPIMATLPGMWNKTISCHSFGKLFSATGVRIGWAIGPKNLISASHAIAQYSAFCLHGPTQLAVSDSLIAALKPYKGVDTYYNWIAKHYEKHRDYFVKNLSEINAFKGKYYIPQGAYYLLINIGDAKVDPCEYKFECDESNKDYGKDTKYILNMAHKKKIVGIPMSFFYTKENRKQGENFIRFAFCKNYETMDKAFDILKKFN